MKKKICDFEFHYICRIEPIKNPTGDYVEFYPQCRYMNKKRLVLNQYGKGPFCNFKIPYDQKESGVYSIFANQEIKYIGECQNLSVRFNNGYGIISPRNCFIGGQETNCRINHIILCAVKKGDLITLWFYITNLRKLSERRLRIAINPEWNRI